MEYVNHFVRVDIAWSYNLIGGLKGIDEVNMQVVEDVFSKAGAFMVAKHQFHMSGDNVQFNGLMHAMREHFDRYQVQSNYFINYYESLFRIISPALAQIPSPIRQCHYICNATGDLEGFVFGV